MDGGDGRHTVRGLLRTLGTGAIVVAAIARRADRAAAHRARAARVAAERGAGTHRSRIPVRGACRSAAALFAPPGRFRSAPGRADRLPAHVAAEGSGAGLDAG